MISPAALPAPAQPRPIRKPTIRRQTADMPAFFRSSLEREDRYVQYILNKADRTRNENRRHSKI